MELTYSDIKNSVKRLCFLTDSEMESYEAAVIEAVNYAMLELCLTYPITEIYEIQRTTPADTGYDRYDMKELTEAMGKDFMGVYGVNSVMGIDSDGLAFNMQCTVIKERYVLLSKKLTGSVMIFYKVYPPRITSQSPGNLKTGFPAQAANLLSLLIAWRIFKDDDPAKAAQYYNEYMAEKQSLNERQDIISLPAVISENGIW